ncbi:A24 family peptidase [Polynucleobacter sp. MWH-UH25E]|uniref:prepilin peptidase n=1 Tax=Polynucleobacter sp. MWH-UH25E TaxID=1855616 RepID=UPI001BFE3801|nr:A24 family peptidase [Polynucleobacter sp. MWH-UH25E]QWD61795.1 prepilin peptidase [Polynucleobacter sp. MWH-UH25E]
MIEHFNLFFGTNTVGSLYFLLLGLIVGSFLNVVIWRMPKALFSNAESAVDTGVSVSPWSCLFNPPSTTPCCGQKIAWRDNIPVFSWLRLRGKCRSCGKHISSRYLLVEFATGLAFMWSYVQFGLSFQMLLHCALFALLIILFWIDIETYYLPDCFTYSVLWLGLLGSAFNFLPLAPVAAILGAAVGYLLPWSINFLYWLWRGRDGFGGGDFKLLGALGAWLGVTTIMPILGLATILALLGVGLQMLLNKEQWNPERMLPFGPFLILAGAIFLFAPNFIRYIII